MSTTRTDALQSKHAREWETLAEPTSREHVQMADRHAEEAYTLAATLEQELLVCGQAMERDRSALAAGLETLRKALRAREWLRLGRGSYECDDDRWHDEFSAAYNEILPAIEALAPIAANWANCPRKAQDVAAARADLQGELARLKRGDFTEAEFQDLCHNLPETCSPRKFADGCAAFQRKLLGCAPDADALAEARKIDSRTERGEVWFWQGDGYDFPESLTCPVIMQAETVRELLAGSQRWRALVGCRRVRVLGYARGGPKGQDGPIRHIGLEFTTDGPRPDGHDEGVATLIEFADAIRAGPIAADNGLVRGGAALAGDCLQTALEAIIAHLHGEVHPGSTLEALLVGLDDAVKGARLFLSPAVLEREEQFFSTRALPQKDRRHSQRRHGLPAPSGQAIVARAAGDRRRG